MSYGSSSAVQSPEILKRLLAQIGNDDLHKYRLIAAVLRQDSAGSGWYALDDSGHTPIGIDSVATSADGMRIEVNYNFSGSEIGAAVVGSDESFAAYPMNFGASVGNSALYIDIFHSFGFRTNGSSVAGTGPMGTKGADWDAVVDLAAGSVVVTHGTSTHSDSQGWPAWAQVRDSDDSCGQVRVTAKSKTGYTLQNYGPLAAVISDTQVVSADAVDTISAVWDGVDTLTITHPTAQSLYDAQVTSRNGRYHAVIRNTSKLNVDVQFQDINSGALFSGANQPASVNFARAGSVCRYPITGSTQIQSGILGPSRVPVTNIAGSSRNLWLYGLVKVA